MHSPHPEPGLRQLKSIIGPQGPIPVSRSTWWAGVKSGRFPTPVKLGPQITAWRDADIQRTRRQRHWLVEGPAVMTEGATFAETISTPSIAGDSAIPASVVPHWPGENLYRGINEATAEGAAVAAGLRSGVLSTIEACVRTLEATIKFKNDVEAVTAFIGPLAEAKILSPNEARLGLKSPKLSRLCKIGRYADWLRSPKMMDYFFDTGCSGSTLIYQASVLLDEMPDELGDDERIEQLVEILRREQVDTRQGMLRLTKELKDARRGPSNSASIPVDSSTLGKSPVPVERLPNTSFVHEGQGFDLVLATPQRSDMRKLREDYDGPLPWCLRKGETIADDVVMIVVAALSDFPVIENKLLPYYGFEGISPRLFLPRAPIDPEVTGAQVIIVAERGSGDTARLSGMDWLSDDTTIDPVMLAAQLVPDAANKLNLFASAETEGYQSIVGGANWSQADD